MALSNRRLLQIAGWGGLIVCGTGFYLQNRLVDNVRAHDYYKTAMKTLRTHAGAVHYLGEPIKDARFKLSDPEKNFGDGTAIKLCIPVAGPKDKGYYYIWADKTNEDWKLNRAELELKTKPDSRLVILKTTTKEN